jgi:hypothetical protein
MFREIEKKKKNEHSIFCLSLCFELSLSIERTIGARARAAVEDRRRDRRRHKVVEARRRRTYSLRLFVRIYIYIRLFRLFVCVNDFVVTLADRFVFRFCIFALVCFVDTFSLFDFAPLPGEGGR